MIKTAVILGAGLGSRLKEITKHKPKGFIELEGISLIERSIFNLKYCGIENIIIGTGYKKEFYEALAKDDRCIETVANPNFESTGSMETLYFLQEIIHEDFILLESDLLYEKKALISLLNDPRKDLVLATGYYNSGDEVFLEVRDGKLVRVSKNRKDLDSVYGELVGITKVSLDAYRELCKLYEKLGNRSLDYEEVIARSGMFHVKKEEVIWCEIDDQSHLKRAEELILPTIKAREVQIKRNLLFTPGPATTTDTVKMAQVVPDICPREEDFGEVMERVARELASLAGEESRLSTILFAGSGTLAVEAMLSSVIPPEGRALIINNGAYGKRMCEIARTYGINFIEFKSSPIAPLDLQEVERALNSEGVTHIAVVHHETTTGLLNDIKALGAIAKKFSAELLVDAISSFGALPINMADDNIAFLASSANKNIQGMPGVSFVIARKESLEKLKDINPRSYYASLYDQYKFFSKTRQMRFTPPVQVIYALKQAIIELKREGIEKRYERYKSNWTTLVKGLEELGFKTLIEPSHHAKLITSVILPKNLDFDSLHDYLYSRGITIYPGKIEGLNTFRIGNIGDLSEEDIHILLSAMSDFLKSTGTKIRY